MTNATLDTSALEAPLNTIANILTESIGANGWLKGALQSIHATNKSIIGCLSTVVEDLVEDFDAAKNNSRLKYLNTIDGVLSNLARIQMPASLQGKDPLSWIDTDMHVAAPQMTVYALTGKLAPTLQDATDHGVAANQVRQLYQGTYNDNVLPSAMTPSELIKWSSGFGLLQTQLLKEALLTSVDELRDYSIPNALLYATTVEDVHQSSSARSLSSFVHPNANGARIGVMEP